MEVLDILTFTFLILLVLKCCSFKNLLWDISRFLINLTFYTRVTPQNLNKQSICVSFFWGKNRSNLKKKIRLPLKVLNKQSICWNFLQRRIENTICIKVLSLTWWFFKEVLSSYLSEALHPEALSFWSFTFLKLYLSEALSSWSFTFLKLYLPESLSSWIFIFLDLFWSFIILKPYLPKPLSS